MPQSTPMFSAKVKIKRAQLPSKPINVRISAAPVEATDIPETSGGSTLKSDARAAFGPSTRGSRNPKWAARAAFKMPSSTTIGGTGSEEYDR
jgi:hypothetical protein